jgi:hypothetical protein
VRRRLPASGFHFNPVENQLQPLQEAAGTVVAVFRDEGISGARGRDKRPGLDALLKGVAHRRMGGLSFGPRRISSFCLQK